MIRFLADADFSHSILKGCRRIEPTMDFRSANEILTGVPDLQVLAIATAEDRILVTHDRKTMPWHFGEYLMRHGSNPGVFLVSQEEELDAVIEAIVMIWAASDAEECRDRILNIPL